MAGQYAAFYPLGFGSDGVDWPTRAFLNVMKWLHEIEEVMEPLFVS